VTLRSARKLRNLSQEGLAAASGVSLSMISLLEAGKRNPSLRIAMMLGDALKMRPEEMFSQVLGSSQRVRSVYRGTRD